VVGKLYNGVTPKAVVGVYYIRSNRKISGKEWRIIIERETSQAYLYENWGLQARSDFLKIGPENLMVKQHMNTTLFFSRHVRHRKGG